MIFDHNYFRDKPFLSQLQYRSGETTQIQHECKDCYIQ